MNRRWTVILVNTNPAIFDILLGTKGARYMRFGALLLSLAVAGCCLGFDDKTSTNEEKTIKQIEDNMLSSLLKGDASTFDRYLADTYVFTDQHGTVSGKEQLIRDIKSGDLKFESSTLHDMKVQIYGDTAIATYASTDKGTYKKKDISGRSRWTDVFVKRNGQWQAVSGHGSNIVPE